MGAIQEIPKQTSIAGMGAVLASKLNQIKSVVASQVTPEKMARIALNELRLNDYLAKLAFANPDSFVNAVMGASHLGLEIGGPLGQAYLVPYKNEIKLIVGYRGLLTLARRSGMISSIKAEIVYEHDTFDLDLGIDPKVTHKPKLNGDRGKPTLVYMVAHFVGGGHHFEWMSITEVNKIRERSPSKDKGPWVTDYEQMALKTVIRRGWKFLPMSIEMQKSEVIEHAADTGKNLVIDGDSVELGSDISDDESAGNAETAVTAIQYMPTKSIDEIVKELGKAKGMDVLERIHETRIAPFTNKMKPEDIDRLNTAYEAAEKQISPAQSNEPSLDELFPG